MKRKLGELLVEAGAVSAADVDNALADQSAGEPSRLGDLLLSTGRCTPRQLAEALAVQHELPFADLSYVAPEASALIPLEFQRAHKIVPFRVEKDAGKIRIHVALSDPTLSDVVEELRSQLKREVVVHVAPIDDIESVHNALAGEGSEGGLVVGTVVEEEVQGGLTQEVTFPEPLPNPTAPPGMADLFGDPMHEPAAPAVTAEDLFGSLDLEATPAVAPLTTDLADEIGRKDASPPTQDFAGFSALAPPMEPLVDRFGAAPSAPALKVVPERKLTAPSAPEPPASAPAELSVEPLIEAEPLLEGEVIAETEPIVLTPAPFSDPLEAPLEPLRAAPVPLSSPQPELPSPVGNDTIKFGGAVPPVEPTRIPSFAIPPDVPLEPRRSPAAQLKGPATLGRIALKRVAVNREGTPVSLPVAAPVAPAPPPPQVIAASGSAAVELELPEWMRSSEPSPVIPLIPLAPAAVGPALDALLARIENGELPSAPALGALFRLLVERGVLDEAAVTRVLEKLS